MLQSRPTPPEPKLAPLPLLPGAEPSASTRDMVGTLRTLLEGGGKPAGSYEPAGTGNPQLGALLGPTLKAPTADKGSGSWQASMEGTPTGGFVMHRFPPLNLVGLFIAGGAGGVLQSVFMNGEGTNILDRSLREVLASLAGPSSAPWAHAEKPKGGEEAPSRSHPEGVAAPESGKPGGGLEHVEHTPAIGGNAAFGPLTPAAVSTFPARE